MTKKTKKVAAPKALSASYVQFAHAFDEWLDANIKNPEKFEHALTTACRHLAEHTLGQEPTYGQACVATLLAYLADD